MLEAVRHGANQTHAQGDGRIPPLIHHPVQAAVVQAFDKIARRFTIVRKDQGAR